ncbi:hypothetical protein CS062_25510, partial [Roseateles chitinivorans]
APTRRRSTSRWTHCRPRSINSRPSWARPSTV